MVYQLVPPGLTQSDPIICGHCGETFTTDIAHEVWSNAYGTFEIKGEFLWHSDCAFAWDKVHRELDPEDETCPLCHPNWTQH